MMDLSIALKGRAHKSKKPKKQVVKGMLEVIETNARGRGGRPRCQVVTARNTSANLMDVTLTGDGSLLMTAVLKQGERRSFSVPPGTVAKKIDVIAF